MRKDFAITPIVARALTLPSRIRVDLEIEACLAANPKSNSRSAMRWRGFLGRGALLFAMAAAAPGGSLAEGSKAYDAEFANTKSTAAAISGEYTTNGLRMNFHGAPLPAVLDYLSEAAGFIINKQSDFRGTVEVWSKQPVTRDEAVELLGSALRKNGYGLTRNGRILTIIALDTVKTADTEIVVNTDPRLVEKSDEVQTEIIPVRYATATQLVANIEPLLPTAATLKANDSANTLIVVASKTDIKRVLNIVSALDTAMAGSSTIKVRPLRYADSKQTASLITQLFSRKDTAQTVDTSVAFPAAFNSGSGGPFPEGQEAPGQASNSSNSSSRTADAVPVVALADERSNSVIISAPSEALASIEGLLDKLDRQVGDVAELRVFRLLNADPAVLAEQLGQLFSDQKSSDEGNQNIPAFLPGGGPPPGAGQSDGDAGAGGSLKRTGKVLAVADARASALIVAAPKTLMPRIAELIATLDADKGKRELVNYFELRNADPQDVYQNLQELFNRGGAGMQNNNNQNRFLGRSNPLTQRQMQAEQTASSALSSGASGNLAGGGAATRPGQ